MTVGEWDQPQLCPDGSCVGLIGPEGTCNVCGRVAPNWGDERNRGLIAPDPAVAEGEDEEDEVVDDDEADDGDENADDGDESADDGDIEPAVGEGDGAWPERELC